MTTYLFGLKDRLVFVILNGNRASVYVGTIGSMEGIESGEVFQDGEEDNRFWYVGISPGSMSYDPRSRSLAWNGKIFSGLDPADFDIVESGDTVQVTRRQPATTT